MKKTIFTLGLALIFTLFSTVSTAGTTNFSGNINAPQPTACFAASASSSGNQWYQEVALKITNQCSSAQDMQNSLITFDAPQAVTSFWGSFSPLAYPQSTSAQSTQEGSYYKISIPLTFAKGNQWWKPNTILPQNGSFTIKFGINGAVDTNALAKSVLVFLNSAPPNPKDGQLTIHAPNAPGNDVKDLQPTAQITGPNDYSKNIQLAWDGQQILKNLAYGSYRVVTEPVGKYQGVPNLDVTLSKDQKIGSVQLLYQQPAPAATLTIRMPKAPVSALPNRTIMLQDVTKQENPQQITVAWDSAKKLDNLVANDSYKAWTREFKANGTVYKPNYTEQAPYTFVAQADQPASVTFSYASEPIPVNIPVTTNIQGLPGAATVKITLTDQDGQQYSHEMSPGSNLFGNVAVGQYNVSAENYTEGNKTYSAELNNPYTITEATTITITYSERPATEAFYAPYMDTSLWPLADPVAIANETGVKHFVFAFIVDKTGSSCDGWYGTYYPMDSRKDQIKTLQDMGGDVMMSFGGAANTPLAAACKDVASLKQEYQKIIDVNNLNFIDFDIEGAWVAESTSIQRRAEAVAQLQAEKPQLKVWLTLPVMPYGLTPDGINVIQKMIDAGVRIDGVNIMAMDYGYSFSESMGQYAIEAAESLFGQLKTLYPQKSDAEVWAMVGITPMIGQNDVLPEYFTLENAQQVLDFAREKNIGFLSNWDVNRDHSCLTEGRVDLKCSGAINGKPFQPSDFDFAAILNQFTN